MSFVREIEKALKNPQGKGVEELLERLRQASRQHSLSEREEELWEKLSERLDG